LDVEKEEVQKYYEKYDYRMRMIMTLSLLSRSS